MTRQIGESNEDSARRRTDVATLDLPQFPWWEYQDDTDAAAIGEVTNRSRNLLELIGDCGDEYRRRG